MTGQSDEWGFIHFSRNKDELEDCIGENCDILDFLRDHVQDHDLKIIDDLISDTISFFKKNSMTQQEYLNNIHGIINDFRGRALNQIPWQQLEENLKRVVLKCADKVTGRDRFVRPPHFEHEIQPRFSQLLDYVLVDWPYPQEHFMYKRDQSSLFRRYVKDVLNILQYLYPSKQDWNYFYASLMIRLNRRATLFFDSRRGEQRYIRHSYSLDHPTPFADYNPGVRNRTREYFEIRNSHAPDVSTSRLVHIQFVAGKRQFRNNMLK